MKLSVPRPLSYFLLNALLATTLFGIYVSVTTIISTWDIVAYYNGSHAGSILIASICVLIVVIKYGFIQQRPFEVVAVSFSTLAIHELMFYIIAGDIDINFKFEIVGFILVTLTAIKYGRKLVIPFVSITLFFAVWRATYWAPTYDNINAPRPEHIIEFIGWAIISLSLILSFKLVKNKSVSSNTNSQ